ncbi:anti-sigma factor [Eoetvoesiella caeni]|nr:anti-sigma factor [Eoetvoesiella caeni]MCI2809898.1 anti-sigma factor [Eoetvoesiella caeni]NYT56185.1 anti-sigma factor [Eoetvoesiella caeni]
MSEHMHNDILAAEYVLGTLRGPARRRFEALMQQDSVLLSHVHRWQETLSVLDAADTPIQPPLRVWRAIQSRLPQRQEATRDSNSPSPSRDSFTKSTMSARPSWKARTFQYRWQFASFALAVALVTITVSSRLFVPDNTGSMYVPVAVLAATQAGQPQQMVVSFDSNNQKLIVTPFDLEAPETGHSLELWLIAKGQKPESLGLLKPQASTMISLNRTRLAPEVTLAVSLEPAGGSPTGQPTGTVLYAGRIGKT